MTLEVSKENVYFAIIIILMIIQVYQQTQIIKLKAEIASLWSQVGIFLMSVTTKFTEIETKMKKDDK